MLLLALAAFLLGKLSSCRSVGLLGAFERILVFHGFGHGAEKIGLLGKVGVLLVIKP